QIRAERDDLDVLDMRGNVDTRLRKLAAGEVDALVRALAGLQRLGRGSHAGAASVRGGGRPAGQGALAIEARAGALRPERFACLIHAESMACVNAERD